MADLLAPGLWWLHGTRGSNVYLVQADDGQFALVDTGFAGSTRAIREELEAVTAGQPLAAILLTHMHFDHSGAARELREATGAKVVAGRGDCFERGGQLFVRSRVGRTHPLRFFVRHREPAPVDMAVTGETSVLPGVRAVPTPGHTAGSLCFVVDRLEAAFVGDLVISHGRTLTRSMRLANRDDHLYLETLKRFAEVAPARGLPGHGEPLLEGFGEAMRGLAALPRTQGTSRNRWERFVRRIRFTRGMMRRRKG